MTLNKNSPDDINQLKKLALSDAKAQNELGTLYQTGQGVTQNYTKAAEYFEKAADQGRADAQYNLGKMYEYGEGVTQNDTKAVENNQKAADQRDADAQQKHGAVY